MQLIINSRKPINTQISLYLKPDPNSIALRRLMFDNMIWIKINYKKNLKINYFKKLTKNK